MLLRRFLTLVPLLLLAASSFMLILINVSGATTDNSFLNRFYFSSVTTTEETRWTMYALCAPVGDGKVYCSSKKPAYPFLPKDNFGEDVVPAEFVKNRNTYFYLLRVGYAMFLLALPFAVLSLLPVLCSCFLAGFISAFLASCVVGSALFFSVLGAAFKTAAHVKGTNAFKKAGYTASLGTLMFVLMWMTVAFLLVSYLWMIFIGVHGARQLFGAHHHHQPVLDSELEYEKD